MEETVTKNPKTGFAIASMVLGIVSIVFYCFWYISVPCAIVGLILGIIARKAGKSGMAVAGIVLSIIALSLLVILWALAVLGIAALGAAGAASVL